MNDTGIPKQDTEKGTTRLLLLANLSICIVVLALGVLLATWNMQHTGALWYDGPRYSNQGAMIYDWLHSGELTHPFEFAKKNYGQYPAFNSPYHPPAYPLMLAGVFSITGVSWTAARLFIGVCAGLLGCFLYAICCQLGSSRTSAFAGALLLLTTPEIVHWSRDTMSEIPGLAVMTLATWLFLHWLSTRRSTWCWLAFACAMVSFFCSVKSIGLLPCWFLFAWWSGQRRRLFSWSLGMCTVVYFGCAVFWVAFVAQFARYEVASDGRANMIASLGKNMSYFWVCVPAALTCGSGAPALAGVVAWVRLGAKSLAGLFWLAWLVSYTMFIIITPMNYETRYFVPALPVLAGLAVCLGDRQNAGWCRRFVMPVVVSVGLIINLTEIIELPRGIVGYQELATHVARLEEPGNVLVACWEDQDFIFRYRSSAPNQWRQMIRSDRSLAIRLPIYALADPEILAHTHTDVIETLKKGRVRFLVTCCPDAGNIDKRTPEMVLAHQVALTQHSSFQLIGEGKLLHEIECPGICGRFFLWKYTGSLPGGPSEIPIVIPTANMSYKMHQ